MRKVLLFALVFGVGLAVLWLVDRSRREGRPTRPPAQIDLPGPEVPPDGPDLTISGRGNFVVYDRETGRRAYTFAADNFEPSGGPDDRSYELTGVLIETFDAETGVLRDRVRAARGRLRLEPAIDLRGLRIADEGRVELNDVIVTRYVGPLAPLELRDPALEVFIERELFRSIGAAPVSVEGRGLRADGRGMIFDGRAERLELDRGGVVRLIDEEGRPVTLSTPIAILAWRLGDLFPPLHLAAADASLSVFSVGAAGGDALEAAASGGSRLQVGVGPVGSVDARTLRVFGRVVEGGRVQVERANAAGDVLGVWGADSFRGGLARLRLGSAGELEHLELEEHPRARMLLSTDEGELPLEIAGVGTLEADLGETGTHFTLGGPGTLKAPSRDLTIVSTGTLRGWFSADGTRATVEAREGVEIRQGTSRAETESLDVDFTAGAEDTIEVRCTGETRVVGRGDDGTIYTLDSDRRIDLEVRDGLWFVPLAEVVRLHVVGTQPFRVTAGTLRDFDWVTRRFVAEDGVTYSSSVGEGEADHAVSRGETGLELFGVPGDPARVRLEPTAAERTDVEVADFEALVIDLQRERIEARGEVHTSVVASGVEYGLDCDFAQLTVAEGAAGAARPFTMVGRGVRELRMVDSDGTTTLSCDTLVAHGTLRAREGGTPQNLEPSDVLATGSVSVHYEGAQELTASGERFIYAAGAGARLETDPDARVQVSGRLPGSGVPFVMSADWIEYDGAELEAERPHIELEVPLLPSKEGGSGAQDPDSGDGAAGAQDPDRPGRTVIESQHSSLDEGRLVFSGDVHLRGVTAEGIVVELDAERVLLGGDFAQGLETGALVDEVRSFQASGGFVLRYGGLGGATGDSVSGTRERIVLEGSPARFEAGGYVVESEFIDVDLVNFVFASTRGVLRAAGGHGAWKVEFGAIRPVISPSGTMFAISNPVYTSPKDEARADFAAIWVHEERWRRRGREALWGEPAAEPERAASAVPLPQEDLVHNLFRQLQEGELARYLRGLLLEGDVEVTEHGKRVARLDEVYMDVELGDGRLSGAEVAYDLQLGSRTERVRIKADEIAIHADGSLRADKATLTACSHDEPHYLVETGELVLIPREGGQWVFSARKNRLAFRGLPKLPLPSLGNLVLDEQGDFVGFQTEEGEVRTLNQIALGNSARFGLTLGAAFHMDIGRVGRTLAGLLGFDQGEVRGRWNYEAAWLSSRGPLLGVGLELAELPKPNRRENFWLNLYASGIPDSGEDRGLVRVPEAERDTFRAWIRGRGRYPFGDREWIDFALSSQSDPGVQSEFYEPDYLRFEQRDTYLHWRKADDNRYYDASVNVRTDNFRTEVAELPSLGVYIGSSPILSIGKLPLLWRMTADVDYLRRQQGDPLFGEDIFLNQLGQPDGLGDRSVLRFLNTHRFEMPIGMGFAGLRATPFVEGSITLWDQGVDQTDQPTRLGAGGGVELATTLYKRGRGNVIHTLTPTVVWRDQFVNELENGVPVRFDRIDDPIDGQEVSAGLRALWQQLDSPNRLDLELTGLRRFDRDPGFQDFERIAALGELRTDLFKTPFSLRFDGRYEPASGKTIYTRLSAANRPIERLLLEVSYGRGLDENQVVLYEAASVAVAFKLDPKWEVEFAQTISLVDSSDLFVEAVVRRFSHDFILEIRAQDRAFEGAALSIGVQPTLGYKPRRDRLAYE